MTRPTIPNSEYSAFVDLTANPEGLHIVDGKNEQQRHSILFASYEVGSHLTLYLADGSLEALRDAINTHLDST
jgi:hypothetical protein